ncbi:hypothetical protein SKAU_G00210990 [Synaphobranchus kaupii]|uniref:Uncharacterized protein n=1 Tax=Synaphobranchus kaupii TaxID=118154 RepID=A0A9Q1F931_SYNKA|nr:hypothetical protein SKAU_G00210990 [Synaphobranchus kaupii]
MWPPRIKKIQSIFGRGSSGNSKKHVRADTLSEASDDDSRHERHSPYLHERADTLSEASDDNSRHERHSVLLHEEKEWRKGEALREYTHYLYHSLMSEPTKAFSKMVNLPQQRSLLMG